MDAYGILEKVREEKPLVHHLTNWVTIYDCANITRAFGALPVMAHAAEEVEEMVGIAGALVLNIGTLTPELVDSMIKAGKAANRKGIPVVLDAVGVGATRLRTDSALKILEEVKVTVLKGNYGEVGVLAGAEAEVKGVESMGVEGDPVELARGLAGQLGLTVAMTGKQDIISDGTTTYLVDNGTEMMGSIVGTGCMAASVIGAFTAVEKDAPKAAAAALSCYGIAGELASKDSRGPGTYKERFYDEVYGLKREEAESKTRLTPI
ncbi:MAG: hydroxyethylthiazole kinase [Candidatus Altiarchaeales archaeon]|nr:hydroxyethylthiazole kinase [Candidatus Altiarchaeales archaeon]MBD3416113.1 hydroxyethylthiazole kinase [Candidatus Altiarchaeales archaeon]